jgi:isopentenyl diphosphate isomerase/L-lactate dehydrogenase-like FMN-dependent dehydrogenase
MDGRRRQTAIYLGGVGGRRPRVPVDPAKLEAKAEEVTDPAAFAYIAGGAGMETTMAANRAAFDRWRIVPRMLRDVGVRDTSVELFGRRLPAPVLTAPIGVLEMVHRQADLAVARAAASLGVPMVFSNQASRPMEACASVMGDSPRWFQMYWSTSNELVESLAKRAEACGCEAIAVTLDTTMLGWRPRDLDVAYLPFLRGKGIAQYTSDPVFTRLLGEPPPAGAPENPKPRPTFSALRVLAQIIRNYPATFSPGPARAAVERFIQIYSRPSLTWEDLAFLRERTSLPILLKGITSPDDARLAVEHGMNGLIVSNHGGRQIDGAISTLDALPGVVEAVGGRIPVLMDSGIRGGADVFKALALGATAVLLGRPYAYGLSIAGEAGVREVLENVLAEFDLTMGLAGCRAVDEIGPETLARI